MKNKIIYISIGAIVVIGIIVSIFIFMPKKVDEPTPNQNNSYSKENIIYLGDYDEMLKIDENYVLENYEDYNKLFNKNELNESDFNNNNYVVVSIAYDSCADEKIDVKDYNINGNNLDINVDYKARCGVCAPQYMYYLIKVDKSITSINTNINYNRTNDPHCEYYVSYKPMIYLYPKKEMNINIKLGNSKLLTTTYPKYENEWNVVAKPNGDIIYNSRKYYGLYWEGYNTITDNFEDGFVVKKDDISSFLEEKLKILGLNEKESNEFIVYWLPILDKNEYNLIRFESIDVINEQMPLIIDPKPDSLIRILMAYKPLENNINIKEQKLIEKERKGYTIVEWGGTIIK